MRVEPWLRSPSVPLHGELLHLSRPQPTLPPATSSRPPPRRLRPHPRRRAQRTVRRLEALLMHPLQRGEMVGHHAVEWRRLGATRTVRRCHDRSGARRGSVRRGPGGAPNRRPLNAAGRGSRSVPKLKSALAESSCG